MYKRPAPGKRGNMSQLGLLDISNLDGEDEDIDLGSDDDMDLEAELAALSGDGGKKPKPKKPLPMPSNDLNAMIAASLKDVPSDDEGSGDDDDPDLLNELKELGIDDDEEVSLAPCVSRPAPAPPSQGMSTQSSTVSFLHDRITNYKAAEKVAKESGESGRARRFARGLKTLQDLLKQAEAGKNINDADIPPAVLIAKPATDTPEAPPVPPRTTSAFSEPTSPVKEAENPSPPDEPSTPEPKVPPPVLEQDPARQEGLNMILKRKAQFTAAALTAKKTGDKALALEYLKVSKQFELVVDAYRQGQEMDLSELPTPEMIAAGFKSPQKGEESVQQSAEPAPAPTASADSPTLITASTVDEALRQRLAAFQQQEAKAKEDGNTSKARRMGRIVKQYQDAIKLHSAGKPIDPELPTPAGFAPLPTSQQASPAPPRPAPAAPATPAASARPSLTRNDKQLIFLMHRQKEFKEAAIRAKKNGDIDKAREYLRAAKGFDAVIDAAKGGLAVDLKSLPLPPKAKEKLEHTFDVVTADDCVPEEGTASISVDDDDAISKLHQQLSSQLKLCLTNRDHYRAMGNVAEMNRFEHLANTVKQDLDVVIVAKSLNQALPKFHYESRQFAIVQCNTDLNENDLELTIVRGISYNVNNPKEIDTYVKFEFPYPQEAPVSDRTALIKDTNNPEYNAVFPLQIHRSSRPCQRVFKRHGIKLEVYSRGGWFSKDTMIGACVVKLAPLQTQVTLHDSLPLMDGRRPAGGSLEVKLRVRTPILQQQIENTKHRWLVIDN